MDKKYPAQEGTWTLVAPDGRKWEGKSPLHACSAEQRERIPASVQLERIFRVMADEEESPPLAMHPQSWEVGYPRALSALPDAAMVRDAARLDGLERHWADGVHVEVCATGNPDNGTLRMSATVWIGDVETFRGNVREAIDAALAAVAAGDE